MSELSLQDPSLQDPSLQDPSLQDPSLQDPSLQDLNKPVDNEIVDNEIVDNKIVDIKKLSRKLIRSYYKIEVVNVTSLISSMTKFMTLHPEFFKTNINKKLVYFSDNHVYSIYTEPVYFRDSIHKVSGYITTDLCDSNYTMNVFVNKTNKNKDCYIKQIENYVNHQTKYGNNVELYYYKILNENMIKHCFYNEPVEQWQKDVVILQNEFFSSHKEYLFAIINDKVKNSGIGNASNSWNNLILYGSPGVGKCLSFDTPVLMYDGSIKKVQDVGVEDLLMGDDSTPRKVLSLARGQEQMYEIKQGDDSYTVNENHVLSLVYSENNMEDVTKIEKFMKEINENLYVNISMKKYLALDGNTQSRLKGYKVGVKFEEKELIFDPYIIGLWLGDDSSNHTVITNRDSTVLKYLVDNVGKYKCYLSRSSGMHYNIRGYGNHEDNPFLNCLNKYDLLNDKYIPKDFKINSRENRLKLLAGLIDGDGYYDKHGNGYEIVQKNTTLSEDIVFLCKSLGFKVSITKYAKGYWLNEEYREGIYNRIEINGEGLAEIPVLSPVKKAYNGLQIKGILSEAITVTPKGINNYYGFELNGNHKFVLGNFIVTHNSSFVYRISMMMKLSILSVDLSLYLNKKKELYSMFHGQEFSLPGDNNKENAINNAIIVLEEFDNAIDKLNDIENIFKYKDVIKREYLTMKNEEIKNRTTELLENYTDAPASKEEEKTMQTKLNEIQANGMENMDYDKFMSSEMLKDGFDIQNNTVFEKAKNNIIKKRDFDNEICGINAELNNIIKNMDDDNKSNILRLSDMLELFQSPIPVKNRIIIATTNKFESIKSSLPALFRAGRMTPIHFDYLDWATLNNLCQYYFQKQLTIAEREIKIPTSEIIELAIKYVLTKKPFEDFEQELSVKLEI